MAEIAPIILKKEELETVNLKVDTVLILDDEVKDLSFLKGIEYDSLFKSHIKSIPVDEIKLSVVDSDKTELINKPYWIVDLDDSKEFCQYVLAHIDSENCGRFTYHLMPRDFVKTFMEVNNMQRYNHHLFNFKDVLIIDKTTSVFSVELNMFIKTFIPNKLYVSSIN